MAHGALPAVEARVAASHHLDEPATLDLLLDLLDARRAPEAHARVEDDVVELLGRPLALGVAPLRADTDREERLGDDVQVLALREVRQRVHRRGHARAVGDRVEDRLPIRPAGPLGPDLPPDRTDPLCREKHEQAARRPPPR